MKGFIDEVEVIEIELGWRESRRRYQEAAAAGGDRDARAGDTAAAGFVLGGRDGAVGQGAED